MVMNSVETWPRAKETAKELSLRPDSIEWRGWNGGMTLFRYGSDINWRNSNQIQRRFVGFMSLTARYCCRASGSFTQAVRGANLHEIAPAYA